jgi:hypothetical protein
MGFVEKNDWSPEATKVSALSASPRICMPTWRNFAREAFRCSRYEAQDVLVEIDDVDLICLDMNLAAWFKESWLRFPLYHNVSSKKIFANLGLKRVKKIQLNRDYDVFVAVCTTFWDLFYINAIERWRDHCKISVCWIDEMWAASIPSKYWLHALSQFDHVFIGCRGTVSALSQAANRRCCWLPGGIDALRFTPFPDPPARVVDVHSIGRRHEGIHRELLKGVERGELFYVHDTVAVANSEAVNHQQHRDLFANIAKRSRFFVVAAAMMNALDKTGGQVETGYRYYEGAAAGAVMIGEAPDCEAYTELFGWPEAVIKIQPDGSDLMAVLSDLGSDPERTAAISRRNTKEALLRHDWVYRWKEMFRVAGIQPSPGLAARERRLRDMAECAARAGENGANTRGAAGLTASWHR